LICSRVTGSDALLSWEKPTGRERGHTPPSKITVLVADPSASERGGLNLILEAEDFDVCAQVDGAEAAVAAVLRKRPDICLMGMTIPHGINATKRIAHLVPETKIIMFGEAKDRLILDSIRAGACGYVSKDTHPAALVATLRGVMAGEGAIPRHFISTLIYEYQGKGNHVPAGGRDRAVRISTRELEVLELLSEEFTTGEIAENLDLSPVTVRRHIASALRKMNLESREAAVRLLRSS
jgi:DNA-binding NarL/FixJ family response regulator